MCTCVNIADFCLAVRMHGCDLSMLSKSIQNVNPPKAPSYEGDREAETTASEVEGKELDLSAYVDCRTEIWSV